MKTELMLLLTATLWVGVNTALAQTQTRSSTIYRCGADGRDLRDSPCPNQPSGGESQLQFDHPSAGQSRAAAEQASADTRRARELEHTRLQQEAQAKRSAPTATGINGPARVEPTDSGKAGKQVPASKPLKSPKPPKPPKAPTTTAAPEGPNVPKPPASPSAPNLAKPAKPSNSAG